MHILDFYHNLKEQKIPIVVDSHQVNKYFQERGYQTIWFDDWDFNSQEIIFIVFSDYQYHDRLKELWKTSKSTVVHLPAIKFDSSLEAIIYTFEQLITCDLEQGLLMRDKTYDKIVEAEEELYLSDARGSQLKCWLANNLEIANADNELQSGWFYSIAEVWESSVVNIQGNKSSFSVEGKLFFDGIIYSANKQEIKDRNQKALNYLFNKIAASQEKYIEVEDNSVTRLVLDDQDETSALLDVEVHPERHLSLTEMAFGCNITIFENVNWRINSVINEGIKGMHLGTGIPNKSPHIDFISTTLKLV